ncbi:MAG: flotillin family protein [Planctomycetes bacterium]|nr:flotillin family protein [Planctomycetota bacterium]
MNTSVLLAQGLPFFEGDAIMLFAVVAGVLIAFGFVMMIVRRYKRCPSNKVLVIYGKVASGRAARTLHGGGSFVWPLIQSFDWLDLDPMQIEIPLQGALSIENIRVNVPSVFTVAIGTDEDVMTNAAIRLLGLDKPLIVRQAEDIIFGQLRQVIASMRIEDINRDRDMFLERIQTSLEPELKKIGLVLINVNIKDITDESGYIEAIGRKAASTAVQQAMIDVAEQEKKGSIGVAEAERERAINVANAEKLREIGTKDAEREKLVKLAELEKEKQIGQQTAAFEQEAQVREAERQKRIKVADANAKAVIGENEAKATIAGTAAELRIREAEALARAVGGENKAKAEVAGANAELRVREAEAYQIGETRHREAEARVREAQYLAEARAAEAQAKKIEMEKRAELEAVARAIKEKVIVDAEADAARTKIEAEAAAGAIFARLEAEARGQYEILAKKGEGLKKIVESCGGSQAAFQMLMLEHIEKLSENASKAIQNIKFDKVVVWDGGGKDGKGGSTANFLQSLAGALPPTLEIMKDIGGVEMPAYLGKLAGGNQQSAQESAEQGGAGEAGPSRKDGPTRPGAARGT